MKPVKSLKFEQALERLEKLIESLEEGELGLDDSLKVFEEGMELTAHCEEKLTEAENKVEILLKGKDGLKKAKPFKKENTNDEQL